MEEKQKKSPKENLLNKITKPWIAYCFCLGVAVLALGATWRCTPNYNVIYIDQAGNATCVQVDSMNFEFRAKVDTIKYIAANDSILNKIPIVQGTQIQEKKDSQLSLWAAALAVIFVLFSVYGLVKVDTTLDKLKEAENRMDENLKEVDKEKSLLKTYQRVLPYFTTSDANGRKKLLEEINKIENIIDFAGNFAEPLYRLKGLDMKEYPISVVEREKEDRYKLVIMLTRIMVDEKECRCSIMDLNRAKMIHALANYRLYKLECCSHVSINELIRYFNDVEEHLYDNEFILCYNSLRADATQDDNTLKLIVKDLKRKKI